MKKRILGPKWKKKRVFLPILEPKIMLKKKLNSDPT